MSKPEPCKTCGWTTLCNCATPPAAAPAAQDAELIRRLYKGVICNGNGDVLQPRTAGLMEEAADRLTALSDELKLAQDRVTYMQASIDQLNTERISLSKQVAALTRERDSSSALVHNICEEWDEACDCTHDAAWGHGADCKATEIAAAKRALRERAESAEARCAAMERDAKRYRWVRARPEMLLHLSNKDFDAAIDTAIAAHDEGSKT
jgi:chromosome segregation ATPase